MEFNYQLLVDVSRCTTLYLLHKYSPFDFLFEDPMGTQHRVQIAHNISCSCHFGNLGHCIHSLYILLRIYKLPSDSAFVHQSSYCEEDLSLIMSQGSENKKKIETDVSKKEGSKDLASK